MSDGPSRQGWRTVKVFLSSTFRDMHAERDHLIKVTFPALREKLLPYRVELYDIDLRWGITEDEAKNEKVIGLCLEQVDECRPFFLAFLGHRYGWVPGQIPDDTQQRFPFVRQFPGVSVTELELRHGAMLDPEAVHARSFCSARKMPSRSIPEATRNRDFVEADPTVARKARGAQAGARSRPAPGAAVLGHLGSEAVRPRQPHRREARRAGRLRQAGRRLALAGDQDGAATSRTRPPQSIRSTPRPTCTSGSWNCGRGIYVGRDDLYRRLRDFALASGETPLLLTGESGLGKSAALARFVRDFRKEHPDVFVLPHFVGASPRTTSLAHHARSGSPRNSSGSSHLTLPEGRVARRDHPHVHRRHHQPAGVGPGGAGLRRPQPARRRQPGRDARLAAGATAGRTCGCCAAPPPARNKAPRVLTAFGERDVRRRAAPAAHATTNAGPSSRPCRSWWPRRSTTGRSTPCWRTPPRATRCS